MKKYDWRIIKTRDGYDHAMSRLLELAETNLQPDTDDFDEFELLNLLIGHYEETEFPMAKPDPIEAIKFRMDQQGLTQADMTQYLGNKSKVSEVLSKKRPLSLSMIRRIHDGLGIPADVLIQDMAGIEWTETETASLGKTVKLFISLNETFDKEVDHFEPEHIEMLNFYCSKSLMVNRKTTISGDEHYLEVEDSSGSKVEWKGKQQTFYKQDNLECLH